MSSLSSTRTHLTSRQSSSTGVFYFLHALFLLHVCTALVTIVNALNGDLYTDDNEAIIQLSIDSIHVVKSSDPRFSNIDENGSDDEERELLLALLSSFDDDHRNKRTAEIESIDDYNQIDNNDEISSTSIVNNSTTPSPPPSTNTSPSIRFIPSLLDFGEQSIAIPRMQTVMIINDDSIPIELESLSGTTVQFYSSFFTQKRIPSHGGNTSLHVYFLPRTFGIVKSTFTIRTNRGIFRYFVHGFGTSNPFRLRPFLGARIPLNSSFERTISLHNPYNCSLNIIEIFSSDDNLLIELILNHSSLEYWHLKPYETKMIMKINYLAKIIGRIHGFFCIKTNLNDTIIVPIEMNVSDQRGLFSNVDLLEFNADRLIRVFEKPAIVPIYVTNNGPYPITVTDVRLKTPIDYVRVQFQNLRIPVGIHRWNKIADLILYPTLIPSHIQRIRGSIQIRALYLSNSELTILQIPFRDYIIHGSLDYERNIANFYLAHNQINQSEQNQCREIKLINRFNTTVAIFNMTLTTSEQYMKIKLFSPFFYLPAGESAKPACLQLIKRSSSSVPFTNVDDLITIHTNISIFHIPVHLYNGFINFNIVNDGTGIRYNPINESEIELAGIPINRSRQMTFTLTNTNPIDISVEKINLTLPNSHIQLVHMQMLNGSTTNNNTIFKTVYTNETLTELVIPARHQATFSLTVNGTSPPDLYTESITFQTPYQILRIDVKYYIVNGTVELANKNPIHLDVFPYRITSLDISIHNGFNLSNEVIRMVFQTYGNCFSFSWTLTSPGHVTLEPNTTHKIGKLNFDMTSLCNNIQIPSESTCYCGLNNHPEFYQRWEQHVSALNTFELDRTLIMKFRNLWNEWTSLVRKQQLQSTIWLITERVNVSWPITIGFVWPSVIELTSSCTPSILDFSLTLINTTKTDNVVIINPSSNLLHYSVELLANYAHNRNKNVTMPHQQQSQSLTISTTSKLPELINGIYRFNLLPNERLTFIVAYRPISTIKQEMFIVVRNNLTVIESILVRGEGGSGNLNVGDRNAGSSNIPLVLEMNDKQYKFCSEQQITNAENPGGYLFLKKVVILHNTGNMKTILYNISFGQSLCQSQGFSVEICHNIEIEPNERYHLSIRFQPDYTVSEISEILTLHTSIGQMTYPLLVRIPPRVLATCYQTLPRPIWELRTYWLCACAVVIIIVLIIAAAIYDAQRLFDDYLARAEWRDRIQMSGTKIFDLSDLSMAVQDEQKTRERLESRSSTSSSVKKDKPGGEIPVNENKVKVTENKARRSVTSINGGSETYAKTNRTTDESIMPVRSSATSPKPVANKTRRSTTDFGQPKPSKQQPSDASNNKTQPNRTVKSINSEQQTRPSPPSPSALLINPSSTVSEEENEPFVLARSKRLSTKTKESPAATVVKTISASNGVAPPPPPAPPVVTTRSSLRSDLAEQRHRQQDFSQSSDSVNDQQWHMVSSNRGQRKSTTSATTTTTVTRRETPDESQTTTKTTKSPLQNSEIPFQSPSSSSHIPSSSVTISNHSTQSRRRRGRRPARPISPVDVVKLKKQQTMHHGATGLSANLSRELAFRQLTEQLWAAGLPSARTTCALSVRSRCSSAPPSERGEMTKNDWTDGDDEDEENLIEWDEPTNPDEDFGRYVSQTEHCMDELNGTNDWNQQQQQPPSINDIPPLMSITTIAPIQRVPAPIVKEKLESLPFPQHAPGPIQRPTKLACSMSMPQQPSSSSSSSSFLTDSVLSPNTPDVLDQINRLLDHQNSTTTPSLTPVPIISSNLTNNPTVSSTIISGLTTPNVQWTHFSSNEWPSKYDSSWPLSSIQSPPVTLATHTQNPFALAATNTDVNSNSTTQQQVPREESSVWSSVLGTITPRPTSSSTRTQRAATWNELFSAAVPSSPEPSLSIKPTTSTGENNSNAPWLKFWQAPDPSSGGGTPSSNGPDNDTTGPFWNPLEAINLGSLSTVPTSIVRNPLPEQSLPSTTSVNWWPAPSADENNNNNSSNNTTTKNTTDDTAANNRDQSRWDFAR